MQSRKLAGVVFTALLMTACGGEGTQPDDADPAGGTAATEEEGDGAPDELTPVSWGVAVRVPTPGQAPYSSVPLEMGYWEEEGLEVDVQGFEGSGAVFQAIDANQLDVGQGPPSTLLSAIAQGAEMVAFYDHVPRNFLLPAVPEDSDIETVSDFQGKTIGVANLEAGGVPLVRAMAQQEGLTEGDDFDIVAVGTGAEAVSFLERGEVEILTLWDSAYAQIENLGIPLRLVGTETFENLGFHNAIVSSEAMMEEQRDVLVGLARGVAKGTVFAHENPEAVVRINWKIYPESKPTGVSEEEALEAAVAELEARNANTAPIDGVWGYSDGEIVQQHMEVLQQAGVIDEVVDVEAVWDGDLLEEVNDFDAEAIRQQARDYQG